MPCSERKVYMMCALYWEERVHDVCPVLRGKWTWHMPCSERKCPVLRRMWSWHSTVVTENWIWYVPVLRGKWTWHMPCSERNLNMTCPLYWEEIGHDAYHVLRGKWTWLIPYFLIPQYRNKAKHLVLLTYWLAACRRCEHTMLEPCLL